MLKLPFCGFERCCVRKCRTLCGNRSSPIAESSTRRGTSPLRWRFTRPPPEPRKVRIRAIRRFCVARTRANAETLTSSAGCDALAARRVADFSTPRGTLRTPGRFCHNSRGNSFFRCPRKIAYITTWVRVADTPVPSITDPPIPRWDCTHFPFASARKMASFSTPRRYVAEKRRFLE